METTTYLINQPITTGLMDDVDDIGPQAAATQIPIPDQIVAEGIKAPQSTRKHRKIHLVSKEGTSSSQAVLKEKILELINTKEKILERIEDEYENKYGGGKPKEVKAEAEKCFLNEGHVLPLTIFFPKNKRRNIEIYKTFGDGGQKQAWRLSSKEALLLPNFNSMDWAPCNINAISDSWNSSVDVEVRVSQFLKRHHMKSCQSKKVYVFPDPKSLHCVPAYICDSFEHLKEQGIFIIEGKSNKSGTWLKNNGNKIFQDSSDRRINKNWDNVFKPLLNDIFKIVKYGIPALGDSFNMAVVQSSPSSPSAPPYHVRYFGFDFSVKGEQSTITLKKQTLSQKSAEKAVSSLLPIYIGRILEIEFHETAEQYSDLKNQLVKKYKKHILRKLKPYIEDAPNLRTIDSASNSSFSNNHDYHVPISQ